MWRLLFLLPLAAACGGGGPGTFTGTVQTHALDVKAAAFVAGTEIWLSSDAELCSKLVKNTLPKSGTIAKLILHPVATGDFTVDPSTSTGKDHTVFLQFLKLDDTCKNTVAFGSSIGTAGTLTVNHLDVMKSVDGTFDVTFGGSDSVRGTFNASTCDAATSYPTPECQ